MEQNILKRYNEIHTMLWEEVIKVFSVRTNEPIEYYKTNTEQIETLYISSLKRTALFNLFVRGKITEQEKDNLLMSNDCAACYVSDAVHSEEFRKYNVVRRYVCRCECCPIKKWNSAGMHCNDYSTLVDKLYDLVNYTVKCINGKKEFNQEVYTSLRKDIIKKIYIIAHLEWRYE